MLYVRNIRFSGFVFVSHLIHAGCPSALATVRWFFEHHQTPDQKEGEREKAKCVTPAY